ncbi:MAG: TerD family protein [Cellulosilyticum sp.]|nr:TerD family protein [Cellulosilyticum sp.]
MAVNLVKGQKIDLTKGNAGLNKIMVGLGWEPVSAGKGFFATMFGGGQKEIDCDSAVIMLSEGDKLDSTKDVIYFGNLTHASNSVCHRGDNLTGEGAGDDEQIFIELKAVPSHINRLIFTVNIYDCISRKQDFGMIKNAFIRVVDVATHQEIARYNLTENYQGCTALEVGEVYRHNGEWKFNAVGNGTNDTSLKEMIKRYL